VPRHRPALLATPATIAPARPFWHHRFRGRQRDEITEEIPASTGVFACMLGGSDGRTLFACTAPDFAEEARKNAREGSLVATRVDTPRAGLP
jgi:sugar lactone lactonase YvrE